MKLKGTITEDSYRAELLRSHQYIFESQKGKSLRKTLTHSFHELKTAYILYWIPEEGEDIYTILIDGHMIAFVEIEKKTGLFHFFKKTKTSISSCSISDYKKGMSKTNQIKLEVAIDLSHKDIEHIRREEI